MKVRNTEQVLNIVSWELKRINYNRYCRWFLSYRLVLDTNMLNDGVQVVISSRMSVVGLYEVIIRS